MKASKTFISYLGRSPYDNIKNSLVINFKALRQAESLAEITAVRRRKSRSFDFYIFIIVNGRKQNEVKK